MTLEKPAEIQDEDQKSSQETSELLEDEPCHSVVVEHVQLNPDDDNDCGQQSEYTHIPLISQERRNSSSSTASEVICRICHGPQTSDAPLITPCGCRGSLEYVHQHCMQRWIKLSQVHACGVCRHEFQIVSKTRPIYRWQSMALSRKERARAVFCSVFLVIGLCGFLYSFEGIVSCILSFIAREPDTRQATLWTFVVRLVFYSFGLLFYSYTLYFYGARNWELFSRWRKFNRDVMVRNIKLTKTNMSKKKDQTVTPKETIEQVRSSIV